MTVQDLIKELQKYPMEARVAVIGLPFDDIEINTAENIESAFGYTPANEERVTQLKQDVVILQELGLLMLDETGKAIVEALTQNEMTQRG